MLIRLTAPEGAAVTLEEAAAALNVDFLDDDGKLVRLIGSETERYEAFTGRIMAPAEFELRCAGFRAPIVLPVLPVREVTAVIYLDAGNAEQALDAADWYVARGVSGWEVRFTEGFSAPALSRRKDPVRVRFSAGYDLPGGAGSPVVAELAREDRDVTNILTLIQRLYDGHPQLTFDQMRQVMGTRRVFR